MRFLVTCILHYFDVGVVSCRLFHISCMVDTHACVHSDTHRRNERATRNYERLEYGMNELNHQLLNWIFRSIWQRREEIERVFGKSHYLFAVLAGGHWCVGDICWQSDVVSGTAQINCLRMVFIRNSDLFTPIISFKIIQDVKSLRLSYPSHPD